MADARRIAKDAWTDLEARIRLVEPRLLKSLPPGATDSDLDFIERHLGSKLPPLVREMYRVHDGIGMPAQVPVGGYMRTCRSYFLCLADALAEWRFLSESLSRGSFDDLKIESVDGPVRAEWWNRLWLPIAADSGGNYHCVDLDPAPGGVVGQVIQFWHDARERTVSAPDLATFLLNHVEEHEWAAVFRVKFAKN